MIDWFGEAQVVSEDGQREASLLACADVSLSESFIRLHLDRVETIQCDF